MKFPDASSAQLHIVRQVHTVCILLAVYLLDEIFQEAQQGIQEVGPIVEFCLKRLTARPAIVKQKVPLSSLMPFCATRN